MNAFRKLFLRIPQGQLIATYSGVCSCTSIKDSDSTMS